MRQLSSEIAPGAKRPLRVAQFGEGNFLRAFADYMVDVLNEKTGFNGAVELIKPIEMGSLDAFKQQDSRYTVVLRGLKEGREYVETRLITSVNGAVDAYGDYDEYAALARVDTLRFIISNTTEAGIVYDAGDALSFCPPRSFPGKLTKLLFERAEHFDYAPDKGLVMLPVELIDDNGEHLKECVLKQCANWALPQRFVHWLNDCCIFASTLVDRIVTGYLRDEKERGDIWQSLGYEDHLLVTGEPFALWVIESQKDLSQELPFKEAGLPVIFTDNQKPYKQRKVRILNGAHTSFVPAAFQCGYDYVLDAMRDPLIKTFMQRTLYDEVIPTLTLPKDDLMQFAEAVTGRFENPYIKHALLSICLNSVSKWRARCMPSLLEYARLKNDLPKRLTFSLASLMALYHGGTLKDGALECVRDGQPYTLRDDADVLAFFANSNSLTARELTKAFLSDRRFFGQDLTEVDGLEQSVRESLEAILKDGMKATLRRLFGA